MGVKNFELFDVEAKVGMYPWRWLEVEVRENSNACSLCIVCIIL